MACLSSVLNFSVQFSIMSYSRQPRFCTIDTECGNGLHHFPVSLTFTSVATLAVSVAFTCGCASSTSRNEPECESCINVCRHRKHWIVPYHTFPIVSLLSLSTFLSSLAGSISSPDMWSSQSNCGISST